MNRMVYSEVRDMEKGIVIKSEYEYDGYGRRTIVKEADREGMRTLYDGTGFEVIRESVVYGNGSFTTNGSAGMAVPSKGTGGLSRYRYVEEEGGISEYRNGGDMNLGDRRYVGINVTLYAKGEAVGMNRLNADNYSGGTGYLGKDIMGCVRGITDGYGVMEGRYEYDVFGVPYEGETNNGMGLGYTGKPYDPITGLYNYGYRDYAPEAARFTTEDPIRDGANWFAYVNNDPVNWIDLWGLADIVIWRAIDAMHDLNWALYDLLVTDSYKEIEKAAKEAGLSIEIINGKDATGDSLRKALGDNEPSRVIIIAHGEISLSNAFVDVEDIRVDLKGIQVGSNLKTIDLVTCYANNDIKNTGKELVQKALGIQDVRGYNEPGNAIYWNQTNDAVKKYIPESITTGRNTETDNPKKTDPLTKVFVGGSGEDNSKGDTNGKKNH
jgi:RHS repeat-associated protein